ncbi:RNA polymerase sigma factor [Paraburkholderia strydomiana]|uniref:RNA polymerase sigma factor n=1 Tax=Paraburkholderia strydomiana TaxID=1245417 RepID=UPI00285E7206|nr:RNA polymerase sigma factor [Paraburkholderia strydomiana]MDR7008903.1 RNA polymerase sigma-70 factor (ECF subfamily) [Paraburkholderia strydomiana]
MSGADLPSMLFEMLPRLWAFALRLSGDRGDAEELVHEASLRALERVHQLEPGKSPLNLMFSIIHSVWINDMHARNIRKRCSFEWDDRLLEVLANPVDRQQQPHPVHTQIVDATQRLPEAQRVVLLLVAVEGMTYQQTADILEVPIGIVMSRLSRARQAVGAMLRDGAVPLVQSKPQKDFIA